MTKWKKKIEMKRLWILVGFLRHLTFKDILKMLQNPNNNKINENGKQAEIWSRLNWREACYHSG
jgi:hypothetical protein